jgi:superfamily II DNA or RNA helicase
LSIQLRDYQQELVEKCVTSLKRGFKKPLLVSPTGSGKTCISSELVRRSYNKGKSSIFIVHRQELLRQTYLTYQKNGITPAVIQGGVNPDYTNPMQIASVNTLVRRFDVVKEPDIIFVDECFVGDTLVLTDHGYKKIRNIKPEELVYTFNEETKEFEYKKVLKLIKKPLVEKLVRVNEHTICTENHLFYTKCGWKKAKDLTECDFCLKDNGSFFKIKGVKNVKKYNEIYVYDLTVEDNHNYFVNGVLVHNCQHQPGSMWARVAERYPNSIMVGLTATPCRLDGKPLSKFFDTMIEVINTKQLIERGYLSPYLYYAPSNIDASELSMSSNGDYSKESLAQASFSARIVGDNIEQYKRLAMGKRNVVFAINRTHAESIKDRYLKEGISAELITGDLDSTSRKKMVERFTTGETKVLVSIDVISEGFDLPAIEVVSLLRPTASTSLYLQQVGRGLRICEGKTHAIILDHVNNYQRHGMPDDVREWTLDSGLTKSKRGQQSTIAIKRCPRCFFAHSPALKCPNCGYVYEANGKDIKEIAGELVLLGSDEYRQAQKKEVIIANTLEELIRIETDRGFKKYWAEKQWELKTGENLWKTFSGLERIAEARNYNHGWAWLQWKKVRG